MSGEVSDQTSGDVSGELDEGSGSGESGSGFDHPRQSTFSQLPSLMAQPLLPLQPPSPSPPPFPPLPACECFAFVSGSALESKACRKVERGKVMCFQYDQSSCPGDMSLCEVNYTLPLLPECGCNRFRNGAHLTASALCVKDARQFGRICYPQDSGYSPTRGGWQNFGCPGDMALCTPTLAQAAPCSCVVYRNGAKMNDKYLCQKHRWEDGDATCYPSQGVSIDAPDCPSDMAVCRSGSPATPPPPGPPPTEPMPPEPPPFSPPLHPSPLVPNSPFEPPSLFFELLAPVLHTREPTFPPKPPSSVKQQVEQLVLPQDEFAAALTTSSVNLTAGYSTVVFVLAMGAGCFFIRRRRIAYKAKQGFHAPCSGYLPHTGNSSECSRLTEDN
mmetsp:Transcript_14209/g.23644  ORF Transcript_14209/g.23644 Transcript_14209/m.23644 type:complete len:387 (+) Transcript_14209:151-1311(+)